MVIDALRLAVPRDVGKNTRQVLGRFALEVTEDMHSRQSTPSQVVKTVRVDGVTTVLMSLLGPFSLSFGGFHLVRL